MVRPQEGASVLHSSVKLLDRDEVGQRAENDGIGYYLTDCCSASVTGVSVTSVNPAGVACRACYQPVDPRLAAAWLVG